MIDVVTYLRTRFFGPDDQHSSKICYFRDIEDRYSDYLLNQCNWSYPGLYHYPEVNWVFLSIFVAVFSFLVYIRISWKTPEFVGLILGPPVLVLFFISMWAILVGQWFKIYDMYTVGVLLITIQLWYNWLLIRILRKVNKHNQRASNGTN